MVTQTKPHKTCTCCGTNYDSHGWKSLPSLPDWHIESLILELRNCACGSTIAVEKKVSSVPPSC